MSQPIAITGTGAVSPAGWRAADLFQAVRQSRGFEPGAIERPLGGETVRTPVHRVPADASAAPKGPRLRRASAITKFAAAATFEALGEDRLRRIAAGELRVGVIFTLMNGCVNYSNRFFGEVLSDPPLASPILFPETVFNAPSSHLSATLGSTAPNDTLIGDASGFISGIDLAAEWICRGDVDGCVVVAAEEADWLSAEAAGLYREASVPAEGAGAVFLEAAEGPVRLLRLPEPISYAGIPRADAARALRDSLRLPDENAALLVSGRSGETDLDAATWHDWSGLHLSPRAVMGEGMGAAVAWQTVVAVEALRNGLAERAVVAAIGSNQQAAGMVIGAL